MLYYYQSEPFSGIHRPTQIDTVWGSLSLVIAQSILKVHVMPWRFSYTLSAGLFDKRLPICNHNINTLACFHQSILDACTPLRLPSHPSHLHTLHATYHWSTSPLSLPWHQSLPPPEVHHHCSWNLKLSIRSTSGKTPTSIEPSEYFDHSPFQGSIALY